MDFGSIEQILDFAIANEEKAAGFYRQLASSVANPTMRPIFLDFAAQEDGHKARLLEAKAGRVTLTDPGTVRDLKISDYLIDVEFTPEMDYQQALILAMKAEKAAYKLYLDLAEAATEPNFRKLFLGLAGEEANHKLRFEIEYDDLILSEN